MGNGAVLDPDYQPWVCLSRLQPHLRFSKVQFSLQRGLPRESGLKMIFAYWDKPDLSPIAAFVAEWQSHFAEFRVLADADIEPLVDKHASTEHLDMYRDIRIPAAKSDIARLLTLYEYGGLYVDCHVGVLDPNGVRQLLD